MSHSQSCYTLPNYPHKPKLLRSYLLRLCAFALATVLVFQTHPCQAQPPNDLETLGVALLQPNQGQHSGIGIGEISIVIGQMASDATLRVIATEAEDRILYPAIEIVPIAPDQLADPPPRRKQDRNTDEDRRIGDGSVLRRLRTAVDKLRDRLDPKEHLRIRFLFVGQAPLRIQLTGEIGRAHV